MARIIVPDVYVSAEKLVAKELERLGYPIVQKFGYHSFFPEEAHEAIASINTPTSLYIRTMADRVAVNNSSVIQVEIKELRDAEYPNIAIEALPALIHRHLWWTFGIDCLYAFTLHNGIKASWVQNLPVFKIILPTRFKNTKGVNWSQLFKQFFPNVPHEEKPTKGSGDPFGLISPNDLSTMPMLEQILRSPNAKNHNESNMRLVP